MRMARVVQSLRRRDNDSCGKWALPRTKRSRRSRRSPTLLSLNRGRQRELVAGDCVADALQSLGGALEYELNSRGDMMSPKDDLAADEARVIRAALEVSGDADKASD